MAERSTCPLTSEGKHKYKISGLPLPVSDLYKRVKVLLAFYWTRRIESRQVCPRDRCRWPNLDYPILAFALWIGWWSFNSAHWKIWASINTIHQGLNSPVLINMCALDCFSIASLCFRSLFTFPVGSNPMQHAQLRDRIRIAFFLPDLEPCLFLPSGVGERYNLLPQLWVESITCLHFFSARA
jgi:hypothetical protein